jgi:hypothetical protein
MFQVMDRTLPRYLFPRPAFACSRQLNYRSTVIHVRSLAQTPDNIVSNPGTRMPGMRSSDGSSLYGNHVRLRHTCATLLLGRNVNSKLVQHLLRRASITMSLDRYSHWIPSMGRHTADGLDEALK